MKYKATIEKADSFNAVLMTKNGYPIYDIMVPSKPGYCSASGIAFYTENEETLNLFEKLDNKQRKEFLLKNLDSIKTVSEILKNSPEMVYPITLAYNHLVYDFEKTVKKSNYGVTHLLEDDKLLIFNQNQVFYKTGLKINEGTQFNELYDHIKTKLYTAYKQGEIKPDGAITGKALQRLKAKNPDMFKEMTQYQEQTLDVLKSFKNELLESGQLTYDKGDNLMVTVQIKNKNYMIEIPENKKDNVTLKANDNVLSFSNIHDLIVELYKNYSQNKLNSFIKKIKM